MAAIPSLCDSSTAATLTHKGARAGGQPGARAGKEGARAFVAHRREVPYI